LSVVQFAKKSLFCAELCI